MPHLRCRIPGRSRSPRCCHAPQHPPRFRQLARPHPDGRRIGRTSPPEPHLPPVRHHGSRSRNLCRRAPALRPHAGSCRPQTLRECRRCDERPQNAPHRSPHPDSPPRELRLYRPFAAAHTLHRNGRIRRHDTLAHRKSGPHSPLRTGLRSSAKDGAARPKAIARRKSPDLCPICNGCCWPNRRWPREQKERNTKSPRKTEAFGLLSGYRPRATSVRATTRSTAPSPNRTPCANTVSTSRAAGCSTCDPRPFCQTAAAPYCWKAPASPMTNPSTRPYGKYPKASSGSTLQSRSPAHSWPT